MTRQLDLPPVLPPPLSLSLLLICSCLQLGQGSRARASSLLATLWPGWTNAKSALDAVSDLALSRIFSVRPAAGIDRPPCVHLMHTARGLRGGRERGLRGPSA